MIRGVYRFIKKKYYALRYHKAYWAEWDHRINDVLSCSDNQYIPRVPHAGKLIKNQQIMHNGLKIWAGSYYGQGITEMLIQNKGVHEPQEERVFQEVLKTLKNNATIVELGAYWSFYAMWFLKEIEYGKAFLFEPVAENLAFGIKNFKLNNFKGDFNQAFIADQYVAGKVPTLNVDYLVNEKQIAFVDLLHADIQGQELNMLKGAAKTLKEHRIGYLFISTHSNQLHQQCLQLLLEKDYVVVCECNLNETYSVDGLIVAKSKFYDGIATFPISKKVAN